MTLITWYSILSVNNPVDIAISPEQKIYVLALNGIYIYDSLLFTFPIKLTPTKFTTDGKSFWVLDSPHEQIYRFEKNGNLIGSLKTPGNDISISDGNLLIAGPKNFLITLDEKHRIELSPEEGTLCRITNDGVFLGFNGKIIKYNQIGEKKEEFTYEGYDGFAPIRNYQIIIKGNEAILPDTTVTISNFISADGDGKIAAILEGKSILLIK